MKCPDCNDELEDTTTNCLNCGWRDTQTQSAISDAPPPQRTETSEGSSVGVAAREPFEEPSEPATEHAESQAGIEQDVKDDHHVFKGRIDNRDSPNEGTQVAQQTNFFGDAYDRLLKEIGKRGQRDEASIYNDTDPMSAQYPEAPRSILDELAAPLNTLMTNHLLFIGSADSDLALGAAQALINDLDIADPEQKRTYDVEEKLAKDAYMGIRSFLPKDKNGNKRVAVIVSAFSDPAQAFATSLISDPVRAYKNQGLLKDSSVFLLCIVDPSYFDYRGDKLGANSTLPHWRIPFLPHFLKKYSDRDHVLLEERIRRLQEAGKWDKDETKLCNKMKGYIESNRLEKEIELAEQASPPPPPNIEVFKDDQWIEKLVLYVATYFSEVSLSEFCDVVEALLGERRLLADDNKTTESSQGSVRFAVEVWRDNKDQFIWNEHFCKPGLDQGLRTIEFADCSMRKSLKEYLGSARKLFLRDQFNILQGEGFIFHPSPRIADKMIRLSAEMAISYPDKYNKDWLVEIIKDLLEQYQSEQQTARPNAKAIFGFIHKAPFNKISWGYSRLSELISQLIKPPQTGRLVSGCLSDLMSLGYHDSVLNLIRRLRFTPDFDGLYWLRQLFDRGDARIKIQAFNHLYDSVRDSSVSIYESLTKLESWFPQNDRDVEKHSQSARFALRLLIKYCFETIYRFSQESRSSASANYILFSFSDEEVARANLDQLVRWLLHPAIVKTLHELESDSGMKNVLSLGLEKKPSRLLGVLMAEWAVILGGLAETSLNETTDEIRGTQSVPAKNVLKLLIERVASSTSNDLKRDLIVFWEEANRELLRSMSNPRLTREKRDQLAVRWNRVFSLTQEFRKMHLTAKAS